MEVATATVRRREGCSHESEDAAVAHLCLPRAPPIPSLIPKEGIVLVKHGVCVMPAEPERAWGGEHTGTWHLLGRLRGTGTDQGIHRGQCQHAGRLLALPAPRLPAARRDPSGTGGFPCQDAQRRRGSSGSACQGTAGSPRVASKPRPPEAAFGSHPAPPSQHRLYPIPTPSYFHQPPVCPRSGVPPTHA